MIALSVLEARSLVEAAMQAVGHTGAEAEIIADHLIDCELRGLSYGGLPRALSVIERVQGQPTPSRPITVLQETPVSAALDGGDKVGYLVARRATEIAIAKATESGLAVVGAHRTWYTGMFSYYLERITKAGFAGMVAGSGAPLVAPHGGTESRFSTNPIAFGFPSDGAPVIWDIGTSAVMLGEMVLKMRLGEPVAEGLAFDAQGAPTLDPGKALMGGALSVWGGPKGAGRAAGVQRLGMMCGQAARPDGLRDCGFFLLVVDPGLLTSATDFKRRVAEFTDTMRATRPADPAKPVRVPFDRSEAERSRRLREDRIEVADEIYRLLKDVCGQPG